ncbi:MAG: hypothetical protein COV45_04900 [Deltaproteobacteria bacterium CG11_big_fil_rev_8_21_14_0_20_47_16]|nr:MAG: hypothetical protein COV45_04900 [Deltaproteobacteria bacterium CG11_big_fil_rev_8_21_14_0_20_47_16]
MRVLSWAVVAVLMLSGSIGFTTSIIPETAQGLTQKANVIFVGTCLARSDKAGPPVTTDYTFNIETAIKGDLQANSTFALHQWRGTPIPINRGGNRLATIPTYEVGQRYMLFLTAPNVNGFRFPVGGGQGVFHVTESNGESIVAQDTLGGRWLFPEGGSQGVSLGKTIGGAPSHSLQLKEFVQAVRKMGGPQ